MPNPIESDGRASGTRTSKSRHIWEWEDFLYLQIIPWTTIAHLCLSPPCFLLYLNTACAMTYAVPLWDFLAALCSVHIELRPGVEYLHSRASFWNSLEIQAVSSCLEVKVTLISRNVLRRPLTPKSLALWVVFLLMPRLRYKEVFWNLLTKGWHSKMVLS